MPNPVNPIVFITRAISCPGRDSALRPAEDGYTLVLWGHRKAALEILSEFIESEYHSGWIGISGHIAGVIQYFITRSAYVKIREVPIMPAAQISKMMLYR